MKRNVLIAGAGQLGSRYLQSLTSSTAQLDIYLYSLDPQSYEVCSKRWIEAGGTFLHHKIVNQLSLDNLPPALDLVVVSLTAESRPELVEQISLRSRVSYWLLEKVLAQNSEGMAHLELVTSGAKATWVNYYRTSEVLYKSVKSHLLSKNTEFMRVLGHNWGLACNALHFIHLYAWLFESQLISVNTHGLSSEWHESKRPGYFEVFGELIAEFANGGRLSLVANPGPVEYSITFKNGSHTWFIDEDNGIAERSDGLRIEARIPFQSERKLLDEILSVGKCDLPSLGSVVIADQVYINAMLNHWQLHKDSLASKVPIT